MGSASQEPLFTMWFHRTREEAGEIPGAKRDQQVLGKVYAVHPNDAECCMKSEGQHRLTI